MVFHSQKKLTLIHSCWEKRWRRSFLLRPACTKIQNIKQWTAQLSVTVSGFISAHTFVIFCWLFGKERDVPFGDQPLCFRGRHRHSSPLCVSRWFWFYVHWKKEELYLSKLCQVKDFQNPGPSLKGLVMESHIEAPKRSLSCFQCGDSKDVVWSFVRNFTCIPWDKTL